MSHSNCIEYDRAFPEYNRAYAEYFAERRARITKCRALGNTPDGRRMHYNLLNEAYDLYVSALRELRYEHAPYVNDGSLTVQEARNLPNGAESATVVGSMDEIHAGGDGLFMLASKHGRTLFDKRGSTLTKVFTFSPPVPNEN